MQEQPGGCHQALQGFASNWAAVFGAIVVHGPKLKIVGRVASAGPRRHFGGNHRFCAVFSHWTGALLLDFTEMAADCRVSDAACVLAAALQYLHDYPDFINYVQCGLDTYIFFMALALRHCWRQHYRKRDADRPEPSQVLHLRPYDPHFTQTTVVTGSNYGMWKHYAGIGLMIAVNGVAFQVGSLANRQFSRFVAFLVVLSARCQSLV